MRVLEVVDAKMAIGAGVSVGTAASVPSLINEWAAALAAAMAVLSAALTIAYTVWKWVKEARRKR